MSNWLVAVLFCVGLLVVSWAVDNSSLSAQPVDKDKGKGKRPEFRAGAVRYQVKDVDRAVQFYTRHLGFKVELAAPAFAAAVRQAFTERYAALYGASAVLEKVPVRLLRLGVEAVGLIDKPGVPVGDLAGPDAGDAEEPARSIYWPEAGGRLRTRVYDGLRLQPGNALEGPAVIELPGTTIITISFHEGLEHRFTRKLVLARLAEEKFLACDEALPCALRET